MAVRAPRTRSKTTTATTGARKPRAGSKPATAPTAPAKRTVRAKRGTTASIQGETTMTTTYETVQDVQRVASVPDIGVYEAYIDRTWAGGHTTMEIYEAALKNRWNVLNEGPTGVAKTMSVEAFAAKMGLPFYAIPNNRSMDVSSIVGSWIPDATGKAVAKFAYGGLTDVFKYGGVVLANEFTFLPDGIMSYLYQALGRERQITLLDNGGEVIKAHKNVLIVADYNPGYQGVRDLNAAVRNRFRIQLPWTYSDDVEAKLIKSEALRDLAKAMRIDAAAGSFLTPISTNMLMEFEQNVEAFSYEFACFSFRTHFAEPERDAVQLLLDTHRANIKADFDGDREQDDDDDDDDMVPMAGEDWGDYGTNWVYDDE